MDTDASKAAKPFRNLFNTGLEMSSIIKMKWRMNSDVPYFHLLWVMMLTVLIQGLLHNLGDMPMSHAIKLGFHRSPVNPKPHT